MLATVSLRDPERHQVLIVAGVGAVAICAVIMLALAYFIQRPMVELQEKIARVGQGELDVAVDFAKRNDEIGDLGRNFNQMVRLLGRAAKRSSGCIARRCRERNTWLRWENWRPGWRMRFAIRWLGLRE